MLPEKAFSADLSSPNPEMSAAAAAALLRDAWGIEAEVEQIASTQDQNFRVRSRCRGDFVLKFVNASVARADVELEVTAMRHLADTAPGFAVPMPVETVDGQWVIESGDHLVRLATWVDGTPLADAGALGAATWDQLGEIAGRSVLGLADLRGAEFDRESQWDPRQGPRVLADLLPGIVDSEQHALARGAVAPLERFLEAGHGAELPVQTIHCDVTDFNVITNTDEGGRQVVTALVDFGDVVSTWRIGEAVSAAASSVYHSLEDPLGSTLAVLEAFHAIVPLDEVEADAFWPMVLARGAVCAVSGTHQAEIAGATDHLSRLMLEDWQALAAMRSVPVPLAVAAARARCGFAPHPRTARVKAVLDSIEPGPLLEIEGRPRTLDLSVGSEDLAFGSWTSRAGIAAMIEAGEMAIGRWGEVRLTAGEAPGPGIPNTLHLGADLFGPEETRVVSPLAGTVLLAGTGEIAISTAVDDEPIILRIAGLRPEVETGAMVGRGELIGKIAAPVGPLPSHVHLQILLEPGVPGLARAREADAALALCPDPGPLLGLETAAPVRDSRAEATARRARFVAAAQRLYYADPPEIVRGWRHLLYDDEGRAYVDAVNNVALVGHSHPAIADAAARSLRLLNTNSRFLYSGMADYAEKLLATLPAGFGRVFFVNSGSEAVDLALRLARAHTGHDDFLAVRGAYHGWTNATFALCTNPGDRPDAADGLEPWVHVVAQPDPYRGAYGEHASPYVDSIRDATAVATDRGGVAGFIAEPLLGNQGGVEPPPGYLAAAYAEVRRAGGVCIADEVQVGMGRTGPDFWAFLHEGVTPDIVCVAKAAGNGYPVGAVICSEEIASSLDVGGGFFSSPAGSPLSCAVGSAVLDILDAERLPANAVRIGGELRTGLEALAREHEAIGAVHGRGLYLGVDLVADRESKRPDATLAGVICERMRELGVIVQPTGDEGNVLKLKPPLCIDGVAAATYVEALGQALTETR
jgi:4-aminobutyrate aminotransferase-like enzyme/Ser/Thr protein kinase RdoA (MazF antagonist)